MEGVLQSVDLQADPVEVLDGRVVTGDGPLEEGIPEAPPHPGGLVLEQLVEAGIDTRLDGPLAEKVGAEGVDRPDEGLVDVAQRRLQQLPRRWVDGLVGQGFLEAILEPLTELRRSLPCERHGRDAPHRLARPHERYHAVHQRGRLARSRPGFDQEVGVEIASDPVAILLVREPRRRFRVERRNRGRSVLGPTTDPVVRATEQWDHVAGHNPSPSSSQRRTRRRTDSSSSWSRCSAAQVASGDGFTRSE